MHLPARFLMHGASDEELARHPSSLHEGGNALLDLGGFLIRTAGRVMLIDVGLGPIGHEGFGQFVNSLREVGVEPADITDVMLTHLHLDHIGWVSDRDMPVFPNAAIRCDQNDIDHFLGPVPAADAAIVNEIGSMPTERRMAPVLSHLETWKGETAIAPGIDAYPAPGHTPGTTVFVVSSANERAVLLGDMVHCPAELIEEHIEGAGDHDPELAHKTRKLWCDELASSGALVTGAHFEGLRFGRVLLGSGKRYFMFA